MDWGKLLSEVKIRRSSALRVAFLFPLLTTGTSAEIATLERLVQNFPVSKYKIKKEIQNGNKVRKKIRKELEPDLSTMSHILKPRCPDLKAEKIEFRLVSRRAPPYSNQGRVEIIGTIRNVGLTAYQSDPGLQDIYLQNTDYPGAPNPLTTQGFQNLAPGQTAQIRYQRDWYSASPAEGEFPPTYRLSISYNPDIYLDGNEKNNDCNWRNNSLEKAGREVNDLFN